MAWVESLDANATIRFVCFCAVFATMLIWEAAAPRRTSRFATALRRGNNVAALALNALGVRLIVPLLPVGAALVAGQRGWGLFNALDAPVWLAGSVSLVALDLAIYGQHVVMHRMPALWRLHRMHHADLDFDVTTGVRFHPLEIVISTCIQSLVVVVLGAPSAVVLAFEVLLNASSMFNHGNVRVPERIEPLLRLIVVTPDMHRVHHSIRPDEANSNFGFNLPWWDRWFRTYRAVPRDGHEGMTVGVDVFRTRADLWLHRMLLQPWRAGAGEYPKVRRARGLDS